MVTNTRLNALERYSYKSDKLVTVKCCNDFFNGRSVC